MDSQTPARSAATRSLLTRVAARIRIAAAGRRCYLFLLVLAGLYAAVLLISRLLGLFPNYFAPITLVAVPGVALVLGILLHRSPSRADAARQVDRQQNTKDLFLTTTLLDEAPGEFKPIVVQQAEEKAPHVVPSRVVPYRWQQRSAIAAASVGILFLGVQFLPQLDPFGKEEKRQKAAQRHRELVESKKATQLKTALLKKQKPEAKNSEQVKVALEDLRQTFNQMKPKEQPANLQKLQRAQQKLSEMWRKRSEERLKEAFAQKPADQGLGGEAARRLERLKRKLSKGDTSEIQKEIDELIRQVQQLQKTADPAQAQEQQQALQRRLKGLSDFLAQNANSKPVQQAAKRALEQLSMAKDKPLTKEALEGLKESLGLSKLEIEKLAQTVRDLEALEGGLRAAQLARQANQGKALDGQQCAGAGCKGMGDYEEFYKKLMGGAGAGEGSGEGDGTGKDGTGKGGIGGRGFGKGGEAPEKPEEKTDFVSEKSRSAFRAGKILMQWKIKDLSDPGTVERNYKDQVSAVKQGVGEAILQEQVPPGYHDAIKKYFDALSTPPEKQP